MTRASHHDLVVDQFGSTANAYVTSSVHAAGPDLDQLENLVRDLSQARVLDLGCGGGHVSFRMAQWTREVVAYDLSTDMLAAVRKEAARLGRANITTQQGVVEKLPFADASFDVVASRFSAHHWHDVPAALREARRVLKPGGVFAMADLLGHDRPLHNTWLQTMELMRDPSHARNLTEAEWRGALSAAGFTVKDATARKLRIEYPSWIKRIGTPEQIAQALRALQGRMPTEVAAYYDLGADGSFTVDTAVIVAI
jgi:ubiquinone/menaquinone biosynthesis C-methylase UbiE